MADDELDELYKVKPDEFTALRTRLAAAAKKRGDVETARKISGSRKPTMAAWVVNQLIHDTNAGRRLAELGEGLSAAHAAMDGDGIRRLSGEQRRLVAELTRTAFETAGLTDPSAAMRADVADTLHAAVADPDVAAQLGRLTKAHRYSGFGAFAQIATSVESASQAGTKPLTRPSSKRARPRTAPDADAKRAAKAREVVAAAEQAKSDADDTLSTRRAELTVASGRHDEAREALQQAEHALAAAEAAYEAAMHAARDAAKVLDEARARAESR